MDVAKYIYENIMEGPPNGPKPAWVEHGNSFKQDEARAHADAILALASPVQREGMVWVPREPTEAMVKAGVEAGVRAGYKGNPWCPAAYAAMLQASGPSDND